MANEVKRGAVRLFTNYARLFSTLAIGLLEVPLQIYWLGKNGFGLIGLLGPTIGLTAILQDMVTRSMVRELGAAYHDPDPKRFERVSAACWLISSLAAALSAVLFAVVTIWVVPLLEIPPELVRPAQWYAAAGGVMSCALVLLTPAANMYIVTERFALQNLWLVGRRLCIFLSAAGLLLVLGRDDVPRSVMLYGVWSSGAVIALLVVSVVIIWAGDRRTWPRPHKAERSVLGEIFGTFGWNSLVTLALNLADKVPALIVNKYFALDGNAAYGLARRLSAYARMITVGATYGLEAVSTRIASATEDSGEALRVLLKHSTRLHTVVAVPAGIAIGVLGLPILHHWAGGAMEAEEYDAVIPIAVVVVQILTLATVCRGISEGWMRLLYGAGFVKHYARLVIVSSFATPVLSWLGVMLVREQSWAVYLPAWVYTVLFVGSYMLILPLIGAKSLSARPGEFIRPMFRPALAAFACAPALWLPGLTGSLTDGALGLVRLAAAAGLYAGAYALACWVVVLSREERRKAIEVIKRRGKRPPGTGGGATGAPRRGKRKRAEGEDGPDFNMPDGS